MYLDALTELVPWFYALDHMNYTRWIPVHLRDMAELTEMHPDIYQEFNSMATSLHRRPSAFFLQSTIDQAHEQSNACVKGDGGAVGLTENPSALPPVDDCWA